MRFFQILSIPAVLFLTSCEPKKPELSEGETLVRESMAAHGGLEKWYGNGQLQFRWVYHMEDKDPVVIKNTLQTFDPKTMAVKHQVADSETTFGMNKGEAWIRPKDAEFSSPPSFWALTPIYFFGIPFVFNDENANFQKLPDPMVFEGKNYAQVKVTYDQTAGNSPDDYYVLLIDPETKITRGAYYIVTNPLVAKDGPGPPKFITLDNLQDFDGVKLPTGHRTFKIEDGKITGQMRFTEVSETKWLPPGTVDLSVPE